MLDGDADDEYFRQFFKVKKSASNLEFEELKQRIEANENAQDAASRKKTLTRETPAYEDEDLEIQLPTLEEFQDLERHFEFKRRQGTEEMKAQPGRYEVASASESVLQTMRNAGSIVSLDQ